VRTVAPQGQGRSHKTPDSARAAYPEPPPAADREAAHGRAVRDTMPRRPPYPDVPPRVVARQKRHRAYPAVPQVSSRPTTTNTPVTTLSLRTTPSGADRITSPKTPLQMAAAI